MNPLGTFFKRLAGPLRRRKMDADLDEEIHSTLDMLTEEKIREGMSASDAARAARIELGGAEQVKENVRAVRTGAWLGTVAQDVRFGLRTLRKNPGFATVAVLTLALGIGANTAIFSIVNAVLLRLLPVRDPQQLVLLTRDVNKRGPSDWGQTGADAKFSLSYPAFAQLEQQNTTLSDVFAFVPLGFSDENVTMSRGGETTSASGIMVTGKYFSGLGVTPLAGRTINERDEQVGAPRVAVISYAYWTSRFARDRGAIGAAVALNGVPFTIVGVVPAAFSGVIPGARPDIWIAFDDAPNLRPWSQNPTGSESVYTARRWLCLNVIGRLKPGISSERATAELDAIYRRFVTQDWQPAPGQDAPGLSLTAAAQGLPYLRARVGQPLLLLMGAVGVVLLIACANVATLLLARASARSKEVGVRLALGATRGRLVRQLLTESLMISLPGGALGFLLALVGTHSLLAVPAKGEYAIFVNRAPDVRVFLFTFGASLFTGLAFGLAPALRSSRFDLASSMKELGADLFARGERHRLGQTLVIGQIAASLALMVAAGLLLRTLINRAHADFGFNQQHLLTFGLDPTRDGYQGDRLITFYAQLLPRIQTLPGVQAATLMQCAPFSGVSNNSQVTIPGQGRATVYRQMRSQNVGPDFFRTMQIPILLGRGIEPSDTSTAPQVVVIDETMAKVFFGDQNPIGRLIGYSTDPNSGDRWQIVGVVKAAELSDVHSDVRSKAYFPYMQHPRQVGTMYFEVRFRGGAEGVISEVRDAVRQSDASLPLLALQTQDEIRDDALTGESILARLSTFFGILALTLSMIGLYGTISYAVSRKTREIGIRMALGAAPVEILRAVIGRGVRIASIGVAIGTIAAFGATRLIRSLIFGVTATDPLTFVAVPALLLVVAVAACYIPARRAMRVDPVSAMRSE